MLWVCNYDSPLEGYTQAGLNYLMALHTAGFNAVNFVTLTGFSWRDMPAWAMPLRQAWERDAAQAPAVYHVQPPSIPAVQLGSARRVGLVVFESDRLPRWVGRLLNEGTLGLIVPGAFNEEGLRASGYTNPIFKVPHTIGPWWWETAPEPEANRPYTFTYVGTWTPRKNPQAVLKAFLDAFPQESEEVALALKISASVGYERQIKEAIGERKDIWLWHAAWQERQIQWLIANTDCFVSAHHGEGWGMGPFQAKLLGKPVIYTDWSAVTEFCSPKYGDKPLEYDLVKTPEGMQSLPQFNETEGSLYWAAPKHESLVESMRWMAAHGDLEAMRAEAAAPLLRNRFSWETVGRQFAEVVERLPR